MGSEPATVYRSEDSGAIPGQRWKASPRCLNRWTGAFTPPPAIPHVRDLRVAPDDPDRLYAGIEVGGMVRSGDGGQNWQQLPGLNDDIHCVSLSDRPA